MKTKQNKLGSYLALTAGVECVASVASGAIQVVDLSGIALGTGTSSLSFPTSTGDGSNDLRYDASNAFLGYLLNTTGTTFYSGQPGLNGLANYARGYQSGPVIFPSEPDHSSGWSYLGSPGGGYSVGLNWVAFKDSADNYGWFSFTLETLGVNSTNPISGFGHFVYDDTTTSPANAIPLETAIASSSPVPEPSGLALLALGATGLVTRRQRRKNFQS